MRKLSFWIRLFLYVMIGMVLIYVFYGSSYKETTLSAKPVMQKRVWNKDTSQVSAVPETLGFAPFYKKYVDAGYAGKWRAQ